MRSLAVAVLGARALSVARRLGASAAAVALARAVGCAALYTLYYEVALEEPRYIGRALCTIYYTLKEISISIREALYSSGH